MCIAIQAHEVHATSRTAESLPASVQPAAHHHGRSAAGEEGGEDGPAGGRWRAMRVVRRDARGVGQRKEGEGQRVREDGGKEDEVEGEESSEGSLSDVDYGEEEEEGEGEEGEEGVRDD